MPSGECFLEIQWAESVDGFDMRCLGCGVVGHRDNDDVFPHKAGCSIKDLEAMERDSVNIARHPELEQGKDAQKDQLLRLVGEKASLALCVDPEPHWEGEVEFRWYFTEEQIRALAACAEEPNTDGNAAMAEVENE